LLLTGPCWDARPPAAAGDCQGGIDWAMAPTAARPSDALGEPLWRAGAGGRLRCPPRRRQRAEALSGRRPDELAATLHRLELEPDRVGLAPPLVRRPPPAATRTIAQLAPTAIAPALRRTRRRGVERSAATGSADVVTLTAAPQRSLSAAPSSVTVRGGP
jgi:hypothetical protein